MLQCKCLGGRVRLCDPRPGQLGGDHYHITYVSSGGDGVTFTQCNW